MTTSTKCCHHGGCRRNVAHWKFENQNDIILAELIATTCTTRTYQNTIAYTKPTLTGVIVLALLKSVLILR